MVKIKNYKRIEGVTPNGGAYSVAYYFNKNNEPCPPQKAYRVEIIEYDKDDNRINITYSLV